MPAVLCGLGRQQRSTPAVNTVRFWTVRVGLRAAAAKGWKGQGHPRVSSSYLTVLGNVSLRADAA